MPADRHQPCFFLAYLPFSGARFRGSWGEMNVARGSHNGSTSRCLWRLSRQTLRNRRCASVSCCNGLLVNFQRIHEKQDKAFLQRSLVVADSPVCPLTIRAVPTSKL
ncbi:hypothetical protein CKAH01_06920 [Colletotrichum kahawae]|uniref:Uncharacterized protein n=1 Tax=Colletotrichum kahawae TaxID=34407 RepID=A0AAE0D2U4_COLKA|nr:hypothetical protein CKAH01_06920 [Colletotrichum kahawae]